MAYRRGKVLSTDELILGMDEDIEYDEDIGYLYATNNQEGHCVYINFKKLFNRDDVAEYCVFKIHLRKYFKIIDLICDDLNYILNQNNDSARMILNMNVKISLSEAGVQEYNNEQFKEDIYTFIETISDDIKEYVESTYCLHLDDTNARINKDLQVTDEMNKKIVSSAVCMRIIIPIICNYLLKEPEDEEKLVYQIFREVVVMMSDNTDCALNKIQRIVQSRIEATNYNNKAIWKKLFDKNDDTKTIILSFYKNIIDAIIPKIEKDKSSIQFIDSVLKNKIDHLFMSKFSADYKPLKSLDNDDDSDERDRINEFSFISNKSEDLLLLNRLTINNIIDSFIKEYELTPNDFKEFERTCINGKNINNIQNFFLNIYYLKDFNYAVTTEKQKQYLLWKMLYELSFEGYEELIEMLSSNLSDEEQYLSTRVSKIKNNRDYVKIFKKYSNVIDIIEKDNFVCKAISFKNLIYINPETKETVEFTNKIDDDILKFFISVI